MSHSMKVRHDLSDFNENEVKILIQDKILILKDTMLLDGGDVNENIDELQDIELVEKEKLQFKMDNLERLKNIGQEHIIEKFNQTGERTMLAKYDEQVREKVQFTKQDGFNLDQHGNYDQQKKNKLQQIKDKLNNKNKGISLNVEKNIANDYFTPKEASKFKMPKPILKKKAKALYDFLEENAENDAKEDHGPREITKKIKKDIVQEQDDIEYNELQNSILKQRKLIQEQQKKTEDDIEQFIQKPSELGQKQNLEMKEFTIDHNKTGKQQIQSIEFSTDFLKNVKNYKQQVDQKMKIDDPTQLTLGNKDSKNGLTSVVNVSLPTERKLNQVMKDDAIQSIIQKQNLNMTTEEYLDDIAQNQEKVDQELGCFIDEVKENRGLGDMLSRLRERGDLQDQIQYSGRAKDKDPQSELKKHGVDYLNQDRIKLEYRDAQGRLMTQKEAFRQLF